MSPLAPYAEILRSELVHRCRKNPQYSLRAFAKFLGVSPAVLSQVLSGKRAFSLKKRTVIVQRLELNPHQRKKFLILDKVKAELPNATLQETEDLISLDEFAYISDWYHLALLSLINMPFESKTPESLAQRLGVHVVQVKDALDRLHRLKLISFDKNNEPIKARTDLQFRNKISTQGTRQFNLQMLQKAIKAIEEEDFSERAASVIFIETSQESVPRVREEIRNFRNYMNDKYSAPKQASDVYCLSVQFFKTTKKISKG